MKTHKYLLTLLAMAVFMAACRKSDTIIDEAEIINDLGSGTETITWEKGNTYILDGLVFVNPGQTLRIEAGTVIRAKTGQSTQASALVVARGGRILAEGTADAPIIFTVEGDDLAGSIPYQARGLWGGIILLGNAPINTASGENSIEGIPEDEIRGIYGGDNPADNSGILRYVSIRHGGTNIGEGNEINGLTLGGVGSKTQIDHVEVISNEDDGFEFFGGTINASHLLAAFCGDDAFDFDLGYSGSLQYIAGIQSPYLGDNLAEHDGGPEEYHLGLPYTTPQIANATFIGNNYATQTHLIKYGRNGAGSYYNSLFVQQQKGIQLELTDEPANCFNQFEQSRIVFSHNLFYDIAQNNQEAIFSLQNKTSQASAPYLTLLNEHFTANRNHFTNVNIGFIAGQFHLIPSSEARGDVLIITNSFFERNTYKGAFGPDEDSWLEPWSLLYEENLLP